MSVKERATLDTCFLKQPDPVAFIYVARKKRRGRGGPPVGVDVYAVGTRDPKGGKALSSRRRVASCLQLTLGRPRIGEEEEDGSSSRCGGLARVGWQGNRRGRRADHITDRVRKARRRENAGRKDLAGTG